MRFSLTWWRRPKPAAGVDKALKRVILITFDGEAYVKKVVRTDSGYMCEGMFQHSGDVVLLKNDGSCIGKFYIKWLPHSGWTKDDLKSENFYGIMAGDERPTGGGI